MASFVFETMTQAQAVGFTSNDFLVFTNSGTTAVNLTVTPNSASGFNNASITLSNGTQSLSFAPAELSGASTAGRLVFPDGSNLVVGTTGNDNTGFGGTTANDVLYGFGGNDTLSGGEGNDYLYGGADGGTGTGAFGDVLAGGNGNDHIYGNALTTQSGQADGADSITGGDGSDYIQGNAGNDLIDGGNGSDSIRGGNNEDTITGANGNDSINGNAGNDTIDGGEGNDYVRGGQGNDSVSGGVGDDIVLGDLGNDTLVGGNGLDLLDGGAGNDVFQFSGADARFNLTTGGATGAQTNGAYAGGETTVPTDTITNFADGADRIAITFGSTAAVPAAVLHATSSAQNMAQAQLIAQGLLSQTGTAANSVAAVTVGSDTYLFYTSAGTALANVDSAIRLQGINDAQITTADFI